MIFRPPKWRGLGESMPKGIDVGLCGARRSDKRATEYIPASLHGSSRLPCGQLGGRISQGAAPPKPATSQTASLKHLGQELTNKESKVGQKMVQNEGEAGPTLKPIESKRDPWKGSKITICAFGLLEASWSGLGAVLEGSRVEKKYS